MLDESALGTRTAKGDWRPRGFVGYAPMFVRPWRTTAVIRWAVGYPGYVFGYNLIYLAVAALAWWVATPAQAAMASLRPGWIAVLLVRNAVIIGAWYGLFHWRLYDRRTQADRCKYNRRWPAERSDRFTFGSQTRDNLFWTLASGLPIWTAWEAMMLWLAASGRTTWYSWSDHRWWFVMWLLIIPLWREVHFHVVHRLIHWPPLYRSVHSLHHRNTNPSPWSGLSMHPVEHVLYFSAVAIHLVIPSHPLHIVFTLVHLAMAPVPGHSGFEYVEIGANQSVATNGYAHYLHHKLFEVNYSDGTLPLDKWTGSHHDGSPEADAAMKERRRARAARTPTPVDD